LEDQLSTSQDQPANQAIMEHMRAIVAILVVVLLAGGFWWWHMLRVTYSTDDAQVTADISDISPKVEGRLVKLCVSEGDAVTAGQELAELDNYQLAVAVAQAEGALEQAKANYAKLPDDLKSAQANVDEAQQALANAQDQAKTAEIALGDAKRDLDETQALYSGGGASKEAYDEATSRYGTAQADLDAARANVLSAQASLRVAQAQLEAIDNTGADSYLAQLNQAQAAYDSAKLTYNESFIYAPISGTVVRAPATVGETLSPGQTILSISNLQSSWVVAYVEETAYGRIRPGQNVDVRVDTYPGRVFSGKVIELGGVTQATGSTFPTEMDEYGNFYKVPQRLPVKIEIANKYGLIFKPGMSVAVKIHTV
jgi:membrane fusion protein (multidrug efflux system)